MTTTVTVKAHCAKEKEVVIYKSTTNTGETIVIQDGESWEGVVYDDGNISVREVVKG
jgi:hypothetical protein